MRKYHRSTFHAVFAEPARTNVAWADIEAMFSALGAEIGEGRGSRVRVSLRGVDAVFHRPHPGKEANRGTVRSVRRFLIAARFDGP